MLDSDAVGTPTQFDNAENPVMRGKKLLGSIGCVRGDNMLTSSGEVEMKMTAPVKVEGMLWLVGVMVYSGAPVTSMTASS